MGKVLKRSI